MAGRTLHVRCATWDQVEVFTARKLRAGKLLSMKVPFPAKAGSPITLGLDLPNDIVVAIDGIVRKVSPVEVDGKVDKLRTWIEIELVGYTDAVKARLAELAKQDAASQPAAQPAAPPRRPSTSQIAEELPEDERELFQHLAKELRRIRQVAVHEVLGVSPEDGPAVVRDHWKQLMRRYHPDLVVQLGAPAVTHLAEELTILANRAYDRMRAKLVAEGRGTVAGPSLATPPGWLVGFEDIQSDSGPAPRARRFERSGSNPASTANPVPTAVADTPSEPVRPTPTPAASIGQGSDAFEQRARASLGKGDANTAREVLAAALVVYPRSKPLRSLYYVATALAALQDGEIMLATSQLETAIAHHEQCVEAVKMLDHIRKHGTERPEEMRRFFR